ncbi:MAG TPA: Ig-like domain-containing protein [Thermoanaerobaculia bacterium]
MSEPLVRVTFPNGGERFQPGQQIGIQWQSSDDFGLVGHDVKFSATGDAPFTDIATNLPGFSQSFLWTVPNLQTSQGVIRVTARNSLGTQSGDRSDGTFTIGQIQQVDTAPPTVQVTFPNGGQQFQPGQPVTIQWISSDNVGVVAHDVKFSSDGGNNFVDIATNLPGSVQSFGWTAPNLQTTQGVIRVVARDAAGNQSGDRSDAPFTIGQIQTIDTIPPTVQVTFPNGGQQFQPGQPVAIQWASSDNVGVFAHDVKFSPTGGDPFQDIATNLPGFQKSFNWIVPNAPTSQGVIRVVARDAAGNQAGDRSDAFFVIAQPIDTIPPTVQVISPNGGEILTPGQTALIRWTSTDNVGVIAHDVKLSSDNGLNFSDIVTNLPGSAQSFSWIVPDAPTSQGVIRVVARDAAGNQGGDRSNSVFTIQIATIEDFDEPSIQPQATFSVVAGLSVNVPRERARFMKSGMLVKECVGREVTPGNPAPPKPFEFTIVPALTGRCDAQKIETCNQGESGDCGRYSIRVTPPVETPPGTYTFNVKSTNTGQMIDPFRVAVPQPKIRITARPRQEPKIFAGEQLDYDVEIQRTNYVGPVRLRVRPGTEVDLSENVFIPQEFRSSSNPAGTDRTTLTIITSKPQADVSPGTGKGSYSPVIEVEDALPFLQVTPATLSLEVDIRPDIDVTISPDRLSAAPEEKAVFTVDLFKYAFQEQDDLRVTGQPTGSKVDFVPAGTKTIKAGKRDRFNLEITPPAGTMPVQFPLTVTAPFTREGIVKTPSAMATLKVEPVEKRIVLSFRSMPAIPGDVRVLECASFDFEVAALGFTTPEPVSLSFERSPSIDLVRGVFVLPNGSTGTTFTPDLNNADNNVVKLRFEVPVDLSKDGVRIKYDFDIVAKLASDPKIESNKISGAFSVLYAVPEVELIPIDPPPVAEESTAKGSSVPANFGFDVRRGTPGCPLFFDQPVTLKVNPNRLPRGVFVAEIQQPTGTMSGSTSPGFVRLGATLEARADRYLIPIEGEAAGAKIIPKEVTLVVDDAVSVNTPAGPFQGFEQLTVTWTTVGPVDSHEIQLSIDGGNQFDKVGETTNAAQRMFSFEINNSKLAEENNSRVRVIAKDRNGRIIGLGDSQIFKIFRTDDPKVIDFTPQDGARGTTVTITGEEFVKGRTEVQFQPAVRVRANVADSRTLTVQVPDGAQTGTLLVITPKGIAATSRPFNVLQSSPRIHTVTAFSPASGPVGTRVTIRGTNFLNVTSVKFRGIEAASFTVDSPRSITAVVPPGAQSGPIEVTTAGGTVASRTPFTRTTRPRRTTGPRPASPANGQGAL